MPSLSRDLRKDLENKVKEARRIAEAGARKALERLGVERPAGPGYLDEGERKLRNKLRAHAKRLGDGRQTGGEQAVERLVGEVAYEHWHRMLFARFLAENDLLIDDGLALTLADVQELAREEKADWLDLAASYAQRMLPEIFRADDPALALPLPPETRSALEDRLKALPAEVFRAEDSLGWVYQFWQAEKKDAVNRSGVKIGADELPAVTQLFTEDYMVLFLLHNTLGAWWAGKVLAADSALAASAEGEAELRVACAPPGVEWTYLRFVRETAEDGTEGPWRPAAGTFPGWPRATKEITFLDPCMGSGHFLVFALPILAALRMAEEGLDCAQAIEAVLRENLHGLEIDPRCTQIAAFALAFAAWRLLGGYAKLPALNLACSGLAIGMPKAEWMKLADKASQLADPGAKRDLIETETTLLNAAVDARVRTGLDRMYELFAKAPVLGSLIDPRRAGGDLFAADYDLLEPILKQALADDSDELAEMAVAAQGLAKAAELLARQYVLVATNVPYLTSVRQDEHLAAFCKSFHAIAKYDIATVSIRRFLSILCSEGTLAVVTPQSWLSSAYYTKFRLELLKTNSWNIISRLGTNAFETITGEMVNVFLGVFSRAAPKLPHHFLAYDISYATTPMTKSLHSREIKPIPLNQQIQLKNPDFRIVFSESNNIAGRVRCLSEYADAFIGLGTGDFPHYGRVFWEIEKIHSDWTFQQSTVDKLNLWGGRQRLVAWSPDEKRVRGMTVAEREQIHNQDQSGQQAWNRRGIAIGLMGELKWTIYTGEKFEKMIAAVIPKDELNFIPILCYCEDDSFRSEVRKLDQKVVIANGTLVKVPFDLAHWQKIAAEKYPDGLPKPHSDDPTQWLFNGHPKGSDDPLQVAVARLVGYRWPRQTGSSFMDCPAIAEPDGLEGHADADGIVCLSSVKGEPAADARLGALLRDAYGDDWTPQRQTALLDTHGEGAKDLDAYLRDRFFARHLYLFQNRPFVWHLWDGRRDGFHALVNYHRLSTPEGGGRRTLEKLVYTYLREWIDRQQSDAKKGTEGAEGRLAAAEHLRQQLEAILTGEPPFDLFVRWKPLHHQPIGWEPDPDDGVRMNIRPFMAARPLEARKAGACILRTTPRIKWDKDRGTEPTREKADFPWFWGWDRKAQDFPGGATFDGNRWNDLHYTTVAKRAAREGKRRV